jgi:hypothetical protein
MMKHNAFVQLDAFETSSSQIRHVVASRGDPAPTPTALPFFASETHAFDLKPAPGPGAVDPNGSGSGAKPGGPGRNNRWKR